MKSDNTNQFKKEVQQWLKTPNHDFDEGFALFARFSHNRALAMQLARKRIMSKLEYELTKIVDRPVIIERSVFPIGSIQKAVAKAKPTAPAAHEPTGTEKIVIDAGKALAAYDDKINPDDLPEDLKKLWDENREAHKRMRALHEQMKLAKTNDERSQRRADIVYLDDKLSKNWEAIEAWKAGKKPATKAPVVKKALKDPVSTARTYVSRNLPKAVKEKDQAKKDKLIANLKERVKILQDHQHEFKGGTLESLKALGIIG